MKVFGLVVENLKSKNCVIVKFLISLRIFVISKKLIKKKSLVPNKISGCMYS